MPFHIDGDIGPVRYVHHGRRPTERSAAGGVLVMALGAVIGLVWLFGWWAVLGLVGLGTFAWLVNR